MIAEDVKGKWVTIVGLIFLGGFERVLESDYLRVDSVVVEDVVVDILGLGFFWLLVCFHD